MFSVLQRHFESAEAPTVLPRPPSFWHMDLDCLFKPEAGTGHPFRTFSTLHWSLWWDTWKCKTARWNQLSCGNSGTEPDTSGSYGSKMVFWRLCPIDAGDITSMLAINSSVSSCATQSSFCKDPTLNFFHLNGGHNRWILSKGSIP